MPIRLSRRQVLGGIAALGAVVQQPTAALALGSGPTCVIRESGTPMDGALVIAALTTTEADRCDRGIEALRDLTGYRRILRFRSSDATRVAFGKALIELFATHPDLRLTARIATAPLGGRPTGAGERDWRYFAHCRDVVAAAVGDTPSATIHIPRQENFRGVRLGETLGTAGSHVLSSERGSSGNLGQLAGLLAGCVRADYLGTTEGARGELVAYLKETLGVTDLTDIDSEKAAVRVAVI